MLSVKILNSDATINNFTELSSIEFIPGEQVIVILRLFDTQKQLRFIPPATCVTSVTLNNIDDTTTVKIGAPLTDDRSILTFELSEIETELLMGGNITLTLDILGDSTLIKKAIGYNVLARVIGDC